MIFFFSLSLSLSLFLSLSLSPVLRHGLSQSNYVTSSSQCDAAAAGNLIQVDVRFRNEIRLEASCCELSNLSSPRKKKKRAQLYDAVGHSGRALAFKSRGCGFEFRSISRHLNCLLSQTSLNLRFGTKRSGSQKVSCVRCCL